MGTPKLRELRRAYGFDEVAIVPGDKTVNPELVDTGFSLNGFTFKTPILAAAMDAIVSPGSASVMHKLGGLSVMNLEGIQTRYDDTQDILDSVINSTQDEETSLLQSIYSAPIDERLIASRVSEMKDTGAVCAVSVTPANTKRFAPVAAEAGADVIEVDPGIDFGYAYEQHRTMQQTEIAHFHASMFKDNEDLYGPKIADYIRLGFQFTATQYVTAMNYRWEMRKLATEALSGVDVLLMPTVSAPAPRDLTQTGDTRFQSPWSFTGFPSITIPSALASNGLPLGTQMASGPFQESKLLAAAAWAEAVLNVSLSPPV